MGILKNPRKTCILLKHRFRKMVVVALGIIKRRNATKHRVFQDPQKLGVLQNPMKTCILTKRRFRKIVGVASGIIKLRNATKRRVFQDLQKRASGKT